MFNLSYDPNNRAHTPHSEKIEGLKHVPAQRTRLPRHISSLESRKHHRANSFDLPTPALTCPLDKQAEAAEAINLAVSILDYQLRDRAAQQQHLANLRSNLQHRLEVAKATQNNQLMSILQEEFQQLETSI